MDTFLNQGSSFLAVVAPVLAICQDASRHSHSDWWIPMVFCRWPLAWNQAVLQELCWWSHFVAFVCVWCIGASFGSLGWERLLWPCHRHHTRSFPWSYFRSWILLGVVFASHHCPQRHLGLGASMFSLRLVVQFHSSPLLCKHSWQWTALLGETWELHRQKCGDSNASPVEVSSWYFLPCWTTKRIMDVQVSMVGFVGLWLLPAEDLNLPRVVRLCNWEGNTPAPQPAFRWTNC